MRFHFIDALCLFVLLGLTAAPARGEAPVPVETVAPIQDVLFEVKAQTEALKTALADEDAYEQNREGRIWQSFGLLAVLGQTLAEHDSAPEAKINGPALRVAAMRFHQTSSLDQARAALANVEQVLAGNVTGEHAVDHPWDKLIHIDPMMEEINGRNSSILRVLRRPRGGEGEPVHATTWAVLSLAMQADTHGVSEEDLPDWNRYSDEFRSAAVKLAEAIRAQDKDEARKWFDKANASCDACHEKFTE